MPSIRRWALTFLGILIVSGCAYGPLPPQPSSNSQTSLGPPQAASPPRIVQKAVANPWMPDAEAREWRHIVIHHTASSGGSVESIHEAHLGRGWDGVGYHFVIGNGDGMGDGQIEPTFRWREQMHGAHAGKTEYNQHGIGICLVGNFEKAPPSSAQLASVKRLVATLKSEYAIPSDRVIPHRDVKATACPGKHFPLAEVGSSRLVPVFAGNGQTQFQVASDDSVGMDHPRQISQRWIEHVAATEGRPVL